MEIERVTVCGAGPGPADGGMLVAVVRDGRGVDPAEVWSDPRAEGAHRVALMLPPRREDCDARVRTFTRAQELSRSVESAMAVGALRGAALTLEEGVTATRVQPLTGGGWMLEAPPVVVGTRDLDDPKQAAMAVGLSWRDLCATLPPRAVSCGPNVMVIPVGSPDAFAAASLVTDAWRAMVGKARHDAALVVLPSDSGAVSLRSLSPEPLRGEDPCHGLGAVAVAGYLSAMGRRPSETVSMAFFAGGTLSAQVSVALGVAAPSVAGLAVKHEN